MKSRSAFVTGSTGFVGLNLVRQLQLDGWEVTALHRASSDLRFLSRFSPALTIGEITDLPSLRRAIPKGCDTVFHVAGNTNLWRKKNDEQTRDNVVGTSNVVEACLSNGVRRLVVTSTTSAFGDVRGLVNEDTVARGGESWVNYEKTKWQAQQRALSAVSSGLEVVVLQPGAIIGPYDLGTWSRLFVLVRDGKLPVVPPAPLVFAHVDEVVKCHVAAAESAPNGATYILGGEPGRMLDLVREIGLVLDKPVPQIEMPLPIMRAVARASEWYGAFTGIEPSITLEAVEGFSRKMTVSSAKAQRELGFQIVPLRTMVRDCYDWLVAEGRI